jgi:glyoxylase-like metal-dependent hydrolase (beta-lactamase superfamily II)
MAGAKQVIPGVWWVGCGSWGGFDETLSVEGSGNVFLVGGDDQFGLVDAGIPAGVGPVLANALGVGVEARMIRRVVLTHAHGDHMLGAPLLRDRTRARIAAAAFTAEGLSGDDKAMEALFLRKDHGFRPFRVDEALEEGDEVKLGPYKFKALMTPGHIPGSVTLFGDVEGRKVLFTGDSAIGDQKQYKGVVGWLDGHWGSNPNHMVKSLRKMLACRADAMMPGHGLPILGKSKVEASLKHCVARVKKLLAIPHLRTMMPLDMSE